LQDVYDERSSMDYIYKNSILAGYTEYEGKWGNIGTKAGLRYEHTWQDVEYRLGNGTNFEKNYGSLVPSASLSYSFSATSNIGLTYNMRISRPGITYLNPYVDQSNPTALSYGNTNLDVEKAHNISLVYNMFTSKLMLNLNLHHNFTDNAIEQYSFFDNTLLNTTYGNIVKRHQTGANVYANWLAAKNTRFFVNGSVNYLDIRSNVLAANNSGWTTTAMVGLQQTLPWNMKLGSYLITSSKSYTLQGWSSGFNLLTANLSKSFFDDKLNIGIMGLVGLSEGGKLKMETYSTGSQFLSHQTIKVPIGSISLSVTYTFGNTKRQMKQHVSRVQSDYIEQKSQGEVLNSVGNMQE
jgi:outer membrane receptor protein involved in Fe transport